MHLRFAMIEFLTTAALLVVGAALNVMGVIALRAATASENVLYAVIGCMCWAATLLVFLALLRTERELAVLAVLTSSLGALAVIAWGTYSGDTLSRTQIAGIGIALVGVALLSMR